jgi:hypothetical protein
MDFFLKKMLAQGEILTAIDRAESPRRHPGDDEAQLGGWRQIQSCANGTKRGFCKSKKNIAKSMA